MTDSANTHRRAGESRSFKSWLKEAVIIIVAAVLISMLIKTFFFRAFYVPSGSMENTLEVQDRIFVNQLVPSSFDLNRGDIVVFEDKKNWLPEALPEEEGPLSTIGDVMVFLGLAPDDSQQYLVKRVIGKGGDTVECCTNGKLSVNGTEVTEPYLMPNVPASVQEFSVRVPDDSLWMMGDNRGASADSRAHLNQGEDTAYIRKSDVVGQVVFIAFPFNRFGSVSSASEYFRHVPDTDPNEARIGK